MIVIKFYNISIISRFSLFSSSVMHQGLLFPTLPLYRCTYPYCYLILQLQMILLLYLLVFYLFCLVSQIQLLRSMTDSNELIFIFPLFLQIIQLDSTNCQLLSFVLLPILPSYDIHSSELMIFIYLLTLSSILLSLHVLTFL